MSERCQRCERNEVIGARGAHFRTKMYMNALKFINIPILIIAFAIGVFYIYVNTSPARKIIVYPGPDNLDKILYRDKSESCFTYEQEKVKCPANKDNIFQIPTQT